MKVLEEKYEGLADEQEDGSKAGYASEENQKKILFKARYNI